MGRHRLHPEGIRGQTIPLAARVVSVVDVFDALTHPRPYKPAWSTDRAVAELVNLRGRYFDPDVLDVYLDEQLWA